MSTRINAMLRLLPPKEEGDFIFMGEALLTSRKGSGSSSSGSEAIGDIKYTCRTDLGEE